MNTQVEELVKQARTLTDQERVELLDALHDLVSPPDPEWAAAWARECEDRCAAIDRGEMLTHDFDEVMEKTRSRLLKP
jgi:hypothetical protein